MLALAIAQWIPAALLGLVGLGISASNWVVFWTIFIRRLHAPSWIPFCGVLLMAAGFALMPQNPVRWLWWVALLLVDEPSNGLDESARKALVGLIADRRSHAVTLIASHDRTIVADLEATIVPWPPST